MLIKSKNLPEARLKPNFITGNSYSKSFKKLFIFFYHTELNLGLSFDESCSCNPINFVGSNEPLLRKYITRLINRPLVL